MKNTTCKICRRRLSDPESIARGIGPECAQRFAFMLCDAGLTVEALGISEEVAARPAVALQIERAIKAMLAGNRRHVEVFKAAALREAA